MPVRESNMGPSHYGQHVTRMLDCVLLNTISDVCLTIQAPVAEWLRRWRAYFSFPYY